MPQPVKPASPAFDWDKFEAPTPRKSAPVSTPVFDWDQFEPATEEDETSWLDSLKSFARGAGKEIVNEVLNIDDMIRRLTGVEANAIPRRKLEGTAENVGATTAQVGGALAGGMGTSAVSRGLPLIGRVATEAIGGGVTAAVQGGDTKTGAGISAAMPIVGRAMSSVAPLLKSGAARSVVKALGGTAEAERVAPGIVAERAIPNTVDDLVESSAVRANAADEALTKTPSAYQQVDNFASDLTSIQDDIQSAREAMLTRRSMPNGTPVPADKATDDALKALITRVRNLDPADTSAAKLSRIKAELESLVTNLKPPMAVRRAVAEAVNKVDTLAGTVAPTRVSTKPIIDAIEQAKQGFIAKGSSGKPITTNPAAYRNLTRLQNTVQDLGEDVSVESLNAFATQWDEMVKSAGRITPETTAWAKKQALEATRREIIKGRPDIAKVEAELKFWSDVNDVAVTTLSKNKAISAEMEAAAQGAGAVLGPSMGLNRFGGAIVAGRLTRMLHRVTTASGWRMTDAKMKDALARAIVSGSSEQVATILARISASQGAQMAKE